MSDGCDEQSLHPVAGPASHELEDLLNQRVEEGIQHSSGHFTQSLDKLQIKLAEYQLQPGQFILKWVQAATLLNCQQINLHLDLPLHFEMVGLDLDPVALEPLVEGLSRPFGLNPDSALANLIFGMLASRHGSKEESARKVVWETSQGQFLELSNGKVNFYTRPVSPQKHSWARISIHGLTTANQAARCFFQSCAYCPIPVYAYGNFIGSPWELSMSDSLGLQYRLAERFVDDDELPANRKIALSASPASLCHRVDRLKILTNSQNIDHQQKQSYQPKVVAKSGLELAQAAMTVSELWDGGSLLLLWHRHGVIVDQFHLDWKTGRIREVRDSSEVIKALIVWPAHGVASDISQLRLQRNEKLTHQIQQALHSFGLLLQSLREQPQDFCIPVRSGTLEVAVGGGLGAVALATLGAFLAPAAAPALMFGTLGCVVAASGYYQFSSSRLDSRRNQEVKRLLQTVPQHPSPEKIILPHISQMEYPKVAEGT